MYNKYTMLRDKNNVTDYQVSKATGINSSMFTHWKNKVYTPKVDKLQAIANYFNVPITYFLEEQEV
ncbi:MAG TPA: XRE family transcriptional regulator [Lachnospiraceae bacterium]|nr:XRE family transcriptional regulator [Lachnospiraceae bacterium]